MQTNDLVEIKDVNQFKFLGRIDNVINSGGAKIFPEQLEALVKKEIPNEIFFIGVKDESLGQKLIAVVEGIESEALNEKLSTINYQQKFHKQNKLSLLRKFQEPLTEK